MRGNLNKLHFRGKCHILSGFSKKFLKLWLLSYLSKCAVTPNLFVVVVVVGSGGVVFFLLLVSVALSKICFS